MCDHCGCRDLTPIARLMAEHDRLRELSGLIRAALADGDSALGRAHFADALHVLDPHVAREEGALFPRLRQVDELTAHVTVLEGEHADLFDAVDDLDVAADDAAWSAGVLRVLHELDEHMFKEDFGLFPAALATLDGDQWDAVEAWERPAATPVSIP